MMVPATPEALSTPSIRLTLGLNSHPLPSSEAAVSTLLPPMWIFVTLGVSSTLSVSMCSFSRIWGVVVVSTPAREIGNDTLE